MVTLPPITDKVKNLVTDIVGIIRPQTDYSKNISRQEHEVLHLRPQSNSTKKNTYRLLAPRTRCRPGPKPIKIHLNRSKKNA